MDKYRIIIIESQPPRTAANIYSKPAATIAMEITVLAAIRPITSMIKIPSKAGIDSTSDISRH